MSESVVCFMREATCLVPEESFCSWGHVPPPRAGLPFWRSPGRLVLGSKL